MLTEKGLQQWITRECKSYDILCYKFQSPAHRGVPDLLLIFKGGIVVFVELKSPKGTGKLSPLQKSTIKKMDQQGAEVYVISSKESFTALVKAVTA